MSDIRDYYRYLRSKGALAIEAWRVMRQRAAEERAREAWTRSGGQWRDREAEAEAERIARGITPIVRDLGEIEMLRPVSFKLPPLREPPPDAGARLQAAIASKAKQPWPRGKIGGQRFPQAEKQEGAAATAPSSTTRDDSETQPCDRGDSNSHGVTR